MPDQTIPLTRYTVKAGRFWQITLQVVPNALCTLSRENETDPAQRMKLYADDEGLIRFHVHPSDERRETALAIECEAEGQVTQYPMELRPHSEPTTKMPSPELNPKIWREGAKIRPGLSLEDALHLTDDELTSRGYPRRPDPQAAPLAFSARMKEVFSPMTLVEARTVARPDIGHGRMAMSGDSAAHGIRPAAVTGSNNWSGFELSASPGTYDWITGSWHVPNVFGEANTHTYSSCWVGLDGDGTTDLVQAGTMQKNIDISVIGMRFSSYHAWTQFLPQQ